MQENGVLMILKISGAECVLAKEIETKGTELFADGTPQLELSGNSRAIKGCDLT
jgi:hypothetical protein